MGFLKVKELFKGINIFKGINMAEKDWTFKQLAAEFMAMVLFVWIGTGAAVSSNVWAEGGGADPG